MCSTGPLRSILLATLLTLVASCGESPTAGGGGGGGEDVAPDTAGDLGRVDVEEGCEDEDGDGYGPGCTRGLDCNDAARSIHPDAPELCDRVDNNCDGFIDEDCPCQDGAVQTCFTGPAGSDGVGRCRAGWQECADARWGECVNQTLPTEERCDALDNNCDGDTDEGLVNACGQCGPEPEEVCGDGLDNNCDGVIDESSAGCDCDDRTGQPCYGGAPQTLGVGRCIGGSFDCIDGDWSACEGQVLPGAEVCDGLDNDCDGLIDEGVANACGQCGAPTPSEVCDGQDNDCDGFVDENLTLVCGACAGDEDDEICNGFDDDCDTDVDEGCVCNDMTDCYPGPPERAGVGLCDWGTRSCDPSGEFWGPCVDFVLPRPEVCDNEDNDCDGLVDISPLGCNVCQSEPESCDGIDNDCDNQVDEFLRNPCGDCYADVEPEELCGPECCDGQDNDCDGLVDEGLLNACGTCGDSCYVEEFIPNAEDDIGEGGELIPADDPDNPTGRAGLTLSANTVLPPFLWVANHDNDTVSRFNTETLREEGRYWVGDNPSRTGVDLDGNVWVGGRNDGRLTKILWDIETCPDRNDNGVVDTATFDNLGPINSAGNPLADECIAYSAVPNPARPSIRGSAPGPDGTIWIGYSTGGIGSIHPNNFTLGPFVDNLQAPLYQPDGSGVQQPVADQTASVGGVYGLVVDSNGDLYTSSYNRNTLARFDTDTGEWLAIYTGVVCGSYGIAVDGRNRIWMGGWPGCRGIGMFDPATNRLHDFAVPETVTPSPGATSGVDMAPVGGCGSTNFCVTGLAAEPATGDIWASFYAIGYTGRLDIDEDNLADSTWTLIGTTRDAAGNFLAGPRTVTPLDSSSVSADLRGVGFDANGFAWTHGLGSDRVYMIDPDTNSRAAALPIGMSVGINTHYTYSDFTGSTALSFTAPRSTWRFRFDTGYPLAQPDTLIWEAYVPPSTTAGIRIRSLDLAGDPTSDWYPAPLGDGTAVYDPYPEGAAMDTVDVRPAGLQGQIFEVEAHLATSDFDLRPIIHEVDLYWQRP